MPDKQPDLRHVRVIDLIRKMNRFQQKLFAHDCAMRTIHLCQEVVPDFHFLQEQLLTARSYIDGCIDSDEMAKALIAVRALLQYEYRTPATYALDSVYSALHTAYSEEKYYPEASVSRTARFARKAAGGAEQLWQRKHALALLESNKLQG